MLFYSIPPADFLLIPGFFVLILHDIVSNPAKSAFYVQSMIQEHQKERKKFSPFDNGDFKNLVCSLP
jgi:hypothetical protein